MEDWNIHEDLIKITKYDLAGELPNPLVFDDGTPVKSPADWAKRRKEICDIQQLVNVIKHVQEGEPLNDRYFKLPFKPMPLPYSWKCPK